MVRKALTALVLLGAGILWMTAAENIRIYAEPVDGNITVWKGYKRMFHSVHGSPNNLVFGIRIQNDSAKFKLQNPDFKVTVPAGVRVEEILGLCSSPRTGYDERFPLQIRKEKQADNSTVYSFPNLTEFFNVHRALRPATREIVFYFEPEKFDPDKEYRILYDFSHNGIKFKQRHLLLKFIPPVPTMSLPRRFRIYNLLNRLWSFKVVDKALLKRIMKKYEAAGLNSAGCVNPNWEKDYEKTLRDAGWHFTHNMVWDPLIYPIAKPVRMAVLANGKTSPKVKCITAAMKNTDLMMAVDKRSLRCETIMDGDGLTIDHEPFGYMKNVCFCKECLDLFASKYKLNRAELTPQIIQKKYADQWLDFAIDNNVRILDLRIQEFKRRCPHSKVFHYNYFLPFDQPEKLAGLLYGCPLDPRRIEYFIDCHIPSTYAEHGNNLIRHMRRQKKYLRKPVGATISTDRSISLFAGYLSPDDMRSPQGTRLEILTVAALNGPLVINYCQTYTHDGMFFHEVAKAMHAIAVCENFYLDGEESQAVTGVINKAWNKQYEDEDLAENFAVITKQLGNETLATVFNYGREIPIKTDFRYQGTLKNFHVSDPVNRIQYLCNGKKAWSSQAFSALFQRTVQPEDTIFVLCSDKPVPADYKTINLTGTVGSDSTAAVSGSALDAEREHIRSKLEQNYPSRKHQTSEIINQPRTVITRTPAQEVKFSLKSGLIVSWKDLKTGTEVIRNVDPEKYNLGAGAAWSMAWQPQSLRDQFYGMHLSYRNYEQNITDDGRIIIKLGFLNENFFICKEFELAPETASVKVATSFKNMRSFSQKAAFVFRSCFDSNQISCQLDGKKVPIESFNNFYYTTQAGKNQHRLAKMEFLGPVIRQNSAKVFLPGRELDFRWKNPAGVVSRVLIYRDEQVSSFEICTGIRTIRSMREFSFVYTMTAVR